MDRKKLITVIVVNILDIITTIVYFYIDNKAGELSPMAGIVGLYQFLAIKLFLVPLLFLLFTKLIFDKKQIDIFFIFMTLFFGIATGNNLLNILLFYVR